MKTTRPTRSGHPLYAMVLFLFVTMTLFNGCVGNPGTSKPIYYYTLNPTDAGVRFDTVLPCILRVERFVVSPPFDSKRIYYADSKSHRNTYAYHQWVVPPGELLPYLFAQELRRSHGFRGVLPPDAALNATHSLHGWVEEFIEKDNPKQWHAAATIHLTLISNGNPDPVSKIMLQKKYHASAPSRKKTPAAIAEAMSAAVNQIMSEAIKDIHHQLTASPTLQY